MARISFGLESGSDDLNRKMGKGTSMARNLQFMRDAKDAGLSVPNVAVVNEVYSLSAKDRAYYEGMIEAFAKAEAQGRASVMYAGEHIDIAHVATAREILRLAEKG